MSAPGAMECPDGLVEDLRAIVGSGHVTTDTVECAALAGDIFRRGHPAGAVASPGNADELAAVVSAAVGAGVAVVPRGGGMSYTGGYVPDEGGSLLIDLARMNRILRIHRDDMTVTAEAGVTWRALGDALGKEKVRTPHWGTLSGALATVGGSLSQNSIFWGSGHHGTAADAVLGLDVVLANGTVLSTGSASRSGVEPFFRHFGPDLTGLFCGDCGALGVKAAATLRLLPEPPARGFGSFAFDEPEAALRAMSDIAREDLAAECFGFDPRLQRKRLSRVSVGEDVRSLAGALKSAGGLRRAIRQGAGLVTAGRRFMDEVRWSVHVIAEDRGDAAVEERLAAIRRIAGRCDGREIAESIPSLTRGRPFGPLTGIVGPAGERWVPVHGIVPHSRAAKTLAAIESVFEANRSRMEALGVETGYLFATVSTHGFVVEPMIFWPDALMPIHHRTLGPERVRRLGGFPENPEAGQLVAELRDAVMRRFAELGAVHLQVGKGYPYRDTLKPEALALISALKQMVDPQNRMNPGALGLGGGD